MVSYKLFKKNEVGIAAINIKIGLTRNIKAIEKNPISIKKLF
jgi:hypothetical protein